MPERCLEDFLKALCHLMFSQHQRLWKNPSQILHTDLNHRSCAWCMLFRGDIRKLALKSQNELVPLCKPEMEPFFIVEKVHLYFICLLYLISSCGSALPGLNQAW